MNNHEIYTSLEKVINQEITNYCNLHHVFITNSKKNIIIKKIKQYIHGLITWIDIIDYIESNYITSRQLNLIYSIFDDVTIATCRIINEEVF